MRKRFIWIVPLLAASLLVVQCSAPSNGGAPVVGQLAPAFALPDLGGRSVALEEQRGKIVLLDFWATWCGPCRRSMPALEQLRREYSEDVVLLAINLQEPRDMVMDYVREQKLEARVLLDGEGQVARTYRSRSIPMQVLIDQEGIVRHIQVGWRAYCGNANPGQAECSIASVHDLLSCRP